MCRPRRSARSSAGGRWAMPHRDFAVTLLDGRRVIGRQHDQGEGWSIYVYPPDSGGSILGYASASTRADAGCGSFRVTRSEWSYDARDGVVEVSGCVDVVSFLSEVVVPVGLEVAVGFDGA